jgi:hypothetical protein
MRKVAGVYVTACLFTMACYRASPPAEPSEKSTGAVAKETDSERESEAHSETETETEIETDTQTICSDTLCDEFPSDIDECADGTHTCDTQHGTCTNTVGGYECGCEEGFMLGADGIGCTSESVFVQVAAGYYHTCGIRADGSVVCLGDDFSGQSNPPKGSYGTGCRRVSGMHEPVADEGNDRTVTCWGPQVR